jgi:hypothetical protein
LANGDELDPGALELSDVESLRVETAAGSLEVALEPAFDVWCKLAGDRVLIVPVVRVEREVHCTVRVAFLANPVAAADDAAATGATPADLAALLEQTDGGDDDLAAADAGPVDRRGPGHEDRRGKGRGGPGTN